MVDERFFQNFVFSDESKKIMFKNTKNRTGYVNTNAEFDSFIINRGIICGMVSISV
jgi:hypothetical protein